MSVEKELKVICKNTYGTDLYYPECHRSQIFADIADTLHDNIFEYDRTYCNWSNSRLNNTELAYCKGHMQMIKKLIARYTMSSVFDIPSDIDLDIVYDWWIKWDTLYIQYKEDGPIVDYLSLHQYDDHDNYKEPAEVVDENGNKIVRYGGKINK
jgi:hypothetical protein